MEIILIYLSFKISIKYKSENEIIRGINLVRLKLILILNRLVSALIEWNIEKCKLYSYS